MEFKIPLPDLSKEEAVEIYLKHGGVVKIEQGKLIYPDKQRIETQLSLLDKKINYLKPLIEDLEKKQRQLNFFNPFNFIQRLSDPLFWKHYSKFIKDEEYRKASKTVAPPIHRINEEKYHKILEQFIENPDYRKSLYEAKTSIINEETLAESVEKSINESKKLIKLRLNKLRKEKAIAFEKKRALMTFLKWTN